MLLIRHFKTFLQEEDGHGLRNDFLCNVVQLHRIQAEMLSAPIKRAPGARAGWGEGILARPAGTRPLRLTQPLCRQPAALPEGKGQAGEEGVLAESSLLPPGAGG